MKFNKNSAHGKAGEHFFAYWIARHFKWPCRLLDIDVGIDAQIEIFDDEQHSTGDFLGVQIKTTEDDKPNVPVDLKNLEYWSTIEDTVLLVSICLGTDTPVLYWKVINDAAIETYIAAARQNDSKTTTITFDTSNVLTEPCKSAIRQLPYRGKIATLNTMIDALIEITTRVNKIFPVNNPWLFSITETENFDLLSIDFHLRDFDRACKKWDDIEDILSVLPKIEKHAPNLKEARNELNAATLNMAVFIADLHSVEVGFHTERRQAWVHSGTHSVLIKLFDEHYPNW
ncbi:MULTISPECIES: DUF4365 domain-containing protein [Pseudomonas]|uniref:DUF4365 domain-containing protein n=1 Tax=Pseudomonas TaxID=286 RepID=UPI001E442BDF|nr:MULTISPECIES: DUF4365 domain-containing protein [Pseudomonas]MCE1117284.1 DUF4365 domain-containing protein [Pseudomonas sp. NMI795_08]